MSTNLQSPLRDELLKRRLKLGRGSLAGLETSELALRVNARQNQTAGVMYARRSTTENKDRARTAILRFFSPKQFPEGLSILTMPSMFWVFERQLLGMREPGGRRPKRTYICAIERDEAIYRASLQWMPDATESLAQLKAAPYASHTMRSFSIVRYHKCEFEALAVTDEPAFDAAWLDFNGQSSTQRLAALIHFWQHRIKRTLAITWMNARHEAEIVTAIKEAGSPFNWLSSHITGGHVAHALNYKDATPMLQMVFEKGERR